MTHIAVNKEGVASFGVELDLKDPQSRISLCKVRLGPAQGAGSQGGAAGAGTAASGVLGALRGPRCTQAVGPACWPVSGP